MFGVLGFVMEVTEEKGLLWKYPRNHAAFTSFLHVNMSESDCTKISLYPCSLPDFTYLSTLLDLVFMDDCVLICEAPAATLLYEHIDTK